MDVMSYVHGETDGHPLMKCSTSIQYVVDVHDHTLCVYRETGGRLYGCLHRETDERPLM